MMNGMFLVLLGLVWKRRVLSPHLLRATWWLAIYGTFANIIAGVIAAIIGAGKMLPIAGGQAGSGPVEGLIGFLLATLSLSMLAVTVFVLIGYHRHMQRGARG